jgi:hypothetical protein
VSKRNKLKKELLRKKTWNWTIWKIISLFIHTARKEKAYRGGNMEGILNNNSIKRLWV